MLIADAQRRITGLPGLLNVPSIPVDSNDALLNIEPAWRKIRLQLNKKVFDTVFVDLGPARMIVIPRLAQVYGARVLDIRSYSQPVAPQKPSLLRRLRGKIVRTLKRS